MRGMRFRSGRGSSRRWLALLCGSLALGATAWAARDERGFVRLKPEEIQFTRLGENAPETALLAGDPNQPGIYVQRNRFPPGIFSLPHSHAEDRHVVVIKGTWWTGTGETFDPSKAIPLGPGSYMKHPAGEVHWDGAKEDEEAIVQIIGVGPGSTQVAHPEAGRFISIQGKK